MMSNSDLEGVRVQLNAKICKRYFDGEPCPRTQKNCNSWHICKDFIENHCTSKCGRSHDFFDVENKDKTKQLGLDKFSNSTIKEILGWSLPQVCPLYLEAKCSSDKCFYLHACSKAVQGLDCVCSLSHNLVDNHNKNVLRKFDLAPRKPQAYGKTREISLKKTIHEATNGSKRESATTVAKNSNNNNLLVGSSITQVVYIEVLNT